MRRLNPLERVLRQRFSSKWHVESTPRGHFRLEYGWELGQYRRAEWR